MILTTSLIILIIVGIIFHELGHWLYLFIVTKKFPEINFTWYGITVGDAKTVSKLSIRQYILMMLSGILAGLPFFIWGGTDIFIIYLLISSFDLSMIIALSQAKKEFKLSGDNKMDDIPCRRCKRIKEARNE